MGAGVILCEFSEMLLKVIKRSDLEEAEARRVDGSWGRVFSLNVLFTHIPGGTRCPICHFTGVETFGLRLYAETGRNTQPGWGWGGEQCHRHETVDGGTYQFFYWKKT